MTLPNVHVKPRSLILKYCFVSDILPTRYVVDERTGFASFARELEGWSASDFNFRVLLAEKLPMLLSSLNEISCGCAIILLLSGSF